ncbi:MAG: CRTAC1 family protein, partial [Acidobacteria bacterium]|nr:CRTAC1 family protein [Acidobacteriota bacterium]
DHYAQRNQLFHNRHDGTFEEKTEEGGTGLELVKVSRSAAFADYDNDGRIDILVGNSGGDPDLLHNTMGADSGHWITLRLEGDPSSRDAVGARVTVKAGDLVQIRQRKAGESYLAGNDPRLHFGLGAREQVDSLEIRWPDGRIETVRNLPADKFYLAHEGRGVVPDPRGRHP